MGRHGPGDASDGAEVQAIERQRDGLARAHGEAFADTALRLAVAFHLACGDGRRHPAAALAPSLFGSVSTFLDVAAGRGLTSALAAQGLLARVLPGRPGFPRA